MRPSVKGARWSVLRKKLGDLRSKALAGEDNVLHRWRPSVKTLARSGDLARTGGDLARTGGDLARTGQQSRFGMEGLEWRNFRSGASYAKIDPYGRKGSRNE